MRTINTQELGRHLKAAREGQSMAQATLAERVDVSVETVSRVERGVISPSFVTVARMAAALDLSLDDLGRGRLQRKSGGRPPVERVVGLLADLDDPTLGSLGDFLRGVSTRRRRAKRPAHIVD